MSSPATITSIEEFVMVNPTEGYSLCLKVEGIGVTKDGKSGFERSSPFEPASSDTQQTSPPEEQAGENPDGIKGKVRRCHERVSGSKM